MGFSAQKSLKSYVESEIFLKKPTVMHKSEGSGMGSPGEENGPHCTSGVGEGEAQGPGEGPQQTSDWLG